LTRLSSVRRTDRTGHRSSRYPHGRVDGRPHQGGVPGGASRLGAAVPIRTPVRSTRRPGPAEGGVGRRLDHAEFGPGTRRGPHHALPLAQGRLRPDPRRAPRRHVGGYLGANLQFQPPMSRRSKENMAAARNVRTIPAMIPKCTGSNPLLRGSPLLQ
jgi:hypothetical protein